MSRPSQSRYECNWWTTIWRCPKAFLGTPLGLTFWKLWFVLFLRCLVEWSYCAFVPLYFHGFFSNWSLNMFSQRNSEIFLFLYLLLRSQYVQYTQLMLMFHRSLPWPNIFSPLSLSLSELFLFTLNVDALLQCLPINKAVVFFMMFEMVYFGFMKSLWIFTFCLKGTMGAC